MKRGVEKHLEGLGFDNAMVLRPGMILGRESPKKDIFQGMKYFGQEFQDKWSEQLYFLFVDSTSYIGMSKTSDFV